MNCLKYQSSNRHTYVHIWQVDTYILRMKIDLISHRNGWYLYDTDLLTNGNAIFASLISRGNFCNFPMKLSAYFDFSILCVVSLLLEWEKKLIEFYSVSVNVNENKTPKIISHFAQLRAFCNEMRWHFSEILLNLEFYHPRSSAQSVWKNAEFKSNFSIYTTFYS